MPKILLVDDMIDMLREEALLIKEAGLGYEVDLCDRGDKALELLERNTYDLVVLDVMMPKKNGIEMLHEIKRRFNSKVMIYSAYLEKISPTTLYQEGADQVLSKPAPLDLFINSIRNLVDPDSDTTIIVLHGYKLREIKNQTLAVIVQKVLRRTETIKEAAEKMGISRECLYSIMKRLGIKPSL